MVVEKTCEICNKKFHAFDFEKIIRCTQCLQNWGTMCKPGEHYIVYSGTSTTDTCPEGTACNCKKTIYQREKNINPSYSFQDL